MPLARLSEAAAIGVPFAIVAGLALERIFMGEALEEFVNRLPATAPEDLSGVLAELLHDQTLRIGYSQRDALGYVDPTGTSVELPQADDEQAVTRVQRDSSTGAVVVHRSAAPDEERFIQAAGAAALMSYQKHRLEVDLSASVLELAASRRRLAEAAYAERQRIERDLHDGIQQRMVSARVKLELAGEAMVANPTRGRRILDEIGTDMDDALKEVRSLAHGVYPALLASTRPGPGAARRRPPLARPRESAGRGGTVSAGD